MVFFFKRIKHEIFGKDIFYLGDLFFWFFNDSGFEILQFIIFTISFCRNSEFFFRFSLFVFNLFNIKIIFFFIFHDKTIFWWRKMTFIIFFFIFIFCCFIFNFLALFLTPWYNKITNFSGFLFQNINQQRFNNCIHMIFQILFVLLNFLFTHLNYIFEI